MLISQHVVLSADYYYQKVTNELDKSEDEPSCPSQGILVQSIQIILLRNDNCPNITKKALLGTDLNNKEKDLVETIQKECNGRPKCDLQETWTIKPTFNCSGSLISADRIRITVQCVETKVDNKFVLDFDQIKQLRLLKNIVIISQNKTLNKTCQLTGNYSQIIITLLYLEFNTAHSENKNDFLSITDEDRNIHLYFQPENISTFQAKNIIVDNATIEVVMNNVFLWMKIEAENEPIMKCSRWIDGSLIPSIKYNVNIEDTSGSTKILIIISTALIVSISSCVALSLVIFRRKRGNKTRTTISNVTSSQSDNQVYNVISTQHDNHIYTEAIVNQRDIHIYTNESANRRQNHLYDFTATDQRDNHIYNPAIIIPPEPRIYSEILQIGSSESGHLEELDLDVEPHYILIT